MLILVKFISYSGFHGSGGTPFVTHIRICICFDEVWICVTSIVTVYLEGLYYLFSVTFAMVGERIVILASSHGRGMREAMLRVDPTLQILSIFEPGARVARLRYLTMQSAPRIARFNAQFIFVHVGHNNMASHPTKPKDRGDVVIRAVLDFVEDIGRQVSSAPVFYSTMFPRVPCGYFNEQRCISYNRVICRLRRYARSLGLNTIVSSGLVQLGNAPHARRDCFEIRDGLHLTDVGRDVVAAAWICGMQQYMSEHPGIYSPSFTINCFLIVIREIPKNI